MLTDAAGLRVDELIDQDEAVFQPGLLQLVIGLLPEGHRLCAALMPEGEMDAKGWLLPGCGSGGAGGEQRRGEPGAGSRAEGGAESC